MPLSVTIAMTPIRTSDIEIKKRLRKRHIDERRTPIPHPRFHLHMCAMQGFPTERSTRTNQKVSSKSPQFHTAVGEFEKSQMRTLFPHPTLRTMRRAASCSSLDLRASNLWLHG